MKKFLIAGNWKMNLDLLETAELCESIMSNMKDIKENVEVLVCPPFTNILTAIDTLEGSAVKVGAQNCHFELKGAFTGEISVDMLKSLNCRYVIIGHSERRTFFHETDELINKKAKTILSSGLKPIICIGETLDERNSNLTFTILERQLSIGLNNIDSSNFVNITIAYEPVWAIGTGVSASTEQAQEAHAWIKNYLVRNFGELAQTIKILYGGSMNEKNAYDLLSQKDVHGGLIGGAALKPESFQQIIVAANMIVD